jgi:hypothetical protein
VEIVKGILPIAWKDEDPDAIALKSMLPEMSWGLPLDPAGCTMEYCMPCMLLDDGMVPAKACMALGRIDEVMASWFTGSISEVVSRASIIVPSLVIDSMILEAEEDEAWRREDDDDGTTGGRAMFAFPCQPFPKSCDLRSSVSARSSPFCLRR